MSSISPIADVLSSRLDRIPADRLRGWRRPSDDAQEPIDAEFTVIEEPRPAQRSTVRSASRALPQVIRRVAGRHASAQQRAVLLAYSPYQEYVGTYIDAWA